MFVAGTKSVTCPTVSSVCAPLWRSEEHTSELQSQSNLVCRLLLEKKKSPRPAASVPPTPPLPRSSRFSPRLHDTRPPYASTPAPLSSSSPQRDARPHPRRSQNRQQSGAPE